MQRRRRDSNQERAHDRNGAVSHETVVLLAVSDRIDDGARHLFVRILSQVREKS